MHQKMPSPIDVHVGSQIRLHRKMLGLSQTALADRLGITFQQVQKYEKGTNRVGASRIQGIASILGIKVNALFPSSLRVSDDEPNSGKEASEINAFVSSNEGMALNKAFRQIENADLRRLIVALVTSVAAAGVPQPGDDPSA